MATAAHSEERTQQKIDFQRILVATDFSPVSQRALEYALAIARRYGSEISIVHAISPEPRESVPLDPLPRELNRARLDAEQDMRRLEKEAHLEDFAHHSVIQQRPVWDVISSIIDRDCPGLLVLGTHGRRALKKFALGSVAEEVLRLASCPVLTVGPKAALPNSDRAGFKSILFATDFGHASARAFPFALFLAEDCQAKLVLLHMVPPMPVLDTRPLGFEPAMCAALDLTKWQSQMRAEGLRKLRDLIPLDAKLASQPEYVVATDFVPEGILEAAAMHHTDLIVMGANRTQSCRVTSHLPWVLIHEVLCKAECPVLTVGNAAEIND